MAFYQNTRAILFPPIYCNYPVIFPSFLLFCERNVSWRGTAATRLHHEALKRPVLGRNLENQPFSDGGSAIFVLHHGALSVPRLIQVSATLFGQDIWIETIWFSCVEVPPDESISSFILDELGINSKLFTDQRDAERYRKSFITQTKASLQIQFPVLCMCNSLVWTNPHLIFTDIAYCFVFLFLCLANWFSIQTSDLKEPLKVEFKKVVCNSNKQKKNQRVWSWRCSRQAAERPAFLLTAQQQAAFGRDDWQVVTIQSKSGRKK